MLAGPSPEPKCVEFPDLKADYGHRNQTVRGSRAPDADGFATGKASLGGSSSGESEDRVGRAGAAVGSDDGSSSSSEAYPANKVQGWRMAARKRVRVQFSAEDAVNRLLALGSHAATNQTLLERRAIRTLATRKSYQAVLADFGVFRRRSGTRR